MMADVVALCERVIVIHHGRLLYDGELAGLSERFAAGKVLRVTVNGPAPDLTTYGEVVAVEANKAAVTIPRADVSGAAAQILSQFEVVDLSIEEPPIEDVIEQAFALSEDEM